MSLSGIYGKSDDQEGIAVIRHALDRGIDMLDSADMYGWGHNEELVGKALEARRSGVFLATKFGQVQTQGGGQGVDARPDYVSTACEPSLRRIKVQGIDLYYQLRVD